ncbi:MAG: thiamine/thiamine pyrophosphate ABC transporter permease ThiP [Pseudomonadota bacterium]
MASRPVQLIFSLAVTGIILIPVAAVLLRGGGFTALNAADYAALRFTIWQAALSAGLSTLFAIPIARALSRRQFLGRSALITLMGAPFILPVIVAILGLLAVFGGNGIVNQILVPLGLPRLDIYGYHGVILAHVFFNLPLAVRLILQGWLTIPAERFRLAASMNLPLWQILEWPMLRRVCPGAFAVIFVICIGSFAVALTLGGGPRATTIELAIYQAFRFEFDLGKAATLATLQLLLGITAGFIALKLSPLSGFGIGLDRTLTRWDGNKLSAKITDYIWIFLGAAFLITPLASVVFSGLTGLASLPLEVWLSALRSIALALATTCITIALAFPLISKTGQIASILGIAVSGLVLGTGFFLILQPFLRPSSVALPVTVSVNAMMALPFVLRILGPAVQDAQKDFGRLADSLSLKGFDRWRIAYLPRIKRPLGFAAGLTAALSMGDLGVITLFSDGDNATLPLQVYRLMNSYQMEAARAAALVLLALSLGLFWLFDKGGRVNAAT